MTAALAVDTSVAIPLLVQTHSAHHAVTRWWDHREIALSGHALAETYSVLTRLPGDLRLAGLPPAAGRGTLNGQLKRSSEMPTRKPRSARGRPVSQTNQ